jgi:molybdate transport system regulatory protein
MRLSCISVAREIRKAGEFKTDAGEPDVAATVARAPLALVLDSNPMRCILDRAQPGQDRIGAGADMTTPPRAELRLENGLVGKAGADRIALIEAIAETGSIAAAAKRVDLSYRAAWDAVQVLNNLFAEPLIAAVPGGAKGGEAKVTPHGAQVVASFRLMEEGLQRTMAELQDQLAGAGGPAASQIWTLGMKTSARNALRGVVESVTGGAVNAEVVLRIGESAEIVAVVTCQSISDLGLVPGLTAVALINAGSIILASAEAGLRTSARNTLKGVIVEIRPGAVNDEVTLELDAGKTLTATVTSESVKRLGLAVGEPAVALVKASHVILAVV